ncbi:MAG: hypothetical protein EON61_09090 [Alphaproteobacteria bacterium]|nr:MAG: hypothetical protein EON61_09090 [Alphaproteobacteria bacterium]
MDLNDVTAKVQAALVQGKLKVAGDMGVAMKLQSLFSKLK